MKSEFNYGKIPPQAIEEEDILLGAIMLVKEVLPEVQQMLFPEVFYKDANQRIYSAILELDKNNNPVDIVTVTNQLKKSGDLDIVGGPFHITTLTNRVGGAGSYEFIARLLLEKWAAREVINSAGEMMRSAYENDADVFSILSGSDNRIQKINDALLGGGKSDSYAQRVDNVVKATIELSKSPNTISGVPTGSKKLDLRIGGWQRTDLIIVAARPGMGKTTRALNFAIAPLMAGMSVAAFSLEMSAAQLIHKQINEDCELLIDQLRTGRLTPYEIEKLKKSAEILKSRKLHIDDTGAISPNHIRLICRKLKKKQGLDLIIVDYLQLMKPNERNRNSNKENDLSDITAAMKAIAKELDVPVILLSQLNREVETRNDKRPQLADLRGSGAIEQDADVVIGIYRGSYYYTEMHEDVKALLSVFSDYGITEEQWKNTSSLGILKNRNGRAGTTVLEMFRGDISRFYDIAGSSAKEYDNEVTDKPF